MPEYKISQSIGGMKEGIFSQLKEGDMLFVQNGVIENFDGQQVTYQNEQSNSFCILPKQKYTIIGQKNIVEQNRIILMLVNADTGESEIGQKSGCNYTTLASSFCLNFSIDHPIHKIIVKESNCETQIFWTDNYNQRRWMSLDTIPFIEGTTQLDCNQILVQPNFSIPTITPITVEIGGALTMGTYQFAIQYANSLGEGYTSYYSITNPLSIFELQYTENFNGLTSKAVAIQVSNLDTTGLYDYFNLVAIKTVNAITSAELIGTYAINQDTYSIVYTGETKSNIAVTIDEIFQRFPYYDIAADITSVDNSLLWADLKEDDLFSTQEIWSKVHLQWENYRIPYTKFEAYNNPINTEDYKGYMSDEVYALEGVFYAKDGKILSKGHIPGRLSNTTDIEIITNKDATNLQDNPCDDPTPKKRWEIYDTSTVLGYTDQYLASNQDNCYKGPYQYGDFGYYESEEVYPDNKYIWGDLVGQKIRFPKFPSAAKVPIHDNNPNGDIGFDHVIYPKGIRVDMQSLYLAINSSSLTTEQKSKIAGFKILRADRKTHESIVAKGLLYNVGTYQRDNSTYFYPNYPFNDLRADPFIASTAVLHHSGANTDKLLQGFTNPQSRYTFHSPDTSFYQPTGIDSGYLNLETIEYGKSKGHFVEVEDNAKYKFLTTKAIYLAFAAAAGSIVSLDTGGGFLGVAPSVTLDTSNIPSTFATMLETIRNIAPFLNYGYQFNSIGNYAASLPVLEEGNKVRTITDGRYIIAGQQAVGTDSVNNFQRESSVYLKLNDEFPNPEEQGAPTDNSRYTLGSALGYQSSPASPLDIEDWWNGLTSQERVFITTNSQDDPTITLHIQSIVEDGGSAPKWKDLLNLLNPGNTNVIPASLAVTRARSAYTLYVSNFDTSTTITCDNPRALVYSDISSYYGAIKRPLKSQYGRIFSYDTVDTGFYSPLYDTNGKQFQTVPAVFGGDTFINRFSLKRKFPFFIDNTVGRSNGSDIALNLLGNVGYPVYFYGTNQIDATIDIDKLQPFVHILTDFDFSTILKNLISGGVAPMVAGLNIMITIFKSYLTTLGVNNINLDCANVKNLNETGKAYLFAYGIPYFFCESQINVDNRQAINETYGNFYPNVGSDIPDQWLQETRISILRDNSYVYNKTYSKQNKETDFQPLRADFDPNKKCYTYHPNQVIWSEKASLEDTKNNWLVYKPASRFFFPKNNGLLTAIDGLEDRRILARFENKSLLYNVYSTVQTSTDTAYIGNPNFFSQKPIDFAETDTGYAGSQHKLLIKTEYGHLTIDSQRGNIYVLAGEQLTEISDDGLNQWFTQNLGFRIRERFPTINIDNSFKNIGLTGTYDPRYRRFVITKRDYLLLNGNITYINNKFYLGTQEVSLDDPRYFCNKSWTISYSLLTKSWVSYHSYIPNYYISGSNYFETGYDTGIWSHDTNITFGKFCGKQSEYILEYPLNFTPNEVIISSFSDYTTVLKYTDVDTYYEVEDGVYFTRAVVYNNSECSGYLNLIPKPKGLSYYRSYPKFNTDSKDIIVTKSDSVFSFNTFWDIVKDKTQPFFSRPCDYPSLNREFDTNLDYTKKTHQKARIRSKEARVRLIYDTDSSYKLISKFIITESQQSIK